jgi:hypothetical protein
MENQQGSATEKTIWALYMKECSENRKTPSVEDFKGLDHVTVKGSVNG